MSDITQTCQTCGKKFLIIVKEQEFLKKKRLPFPSICPTDRQAERVKNRGERTLYKTICQQCGTSVITSYDPKSVTNKILCRKCYAEYFEKNEILKS